MSRRAGRSGVQRGAPEPRGPLAVSLDASAIPAKAAGAGRYVAGLLQALSSLEELSLVVWTRVDDGARWQDLAPRAQILAKAPVLRPARLVWEQLRLGREIQDTGASIHHGPHYTMPALRSVPCVVTIHDMSFFDHPEWHERAKVAFFRQAIRLAVRSAAGIICVSGYTRDRLLARFQPKCPVFVIEHGVDLERFRPDPPRGPDSDEAVLGAFGIRRPYVCYIGTVEPRKDVVGLVAAFDRIAPAHPALQLVIAGQAGWGEKELVASIAGARHADRVLRLGYVPDEAVPALLRQAAAFAYPSRLEGFGLPVLEALACGTAVVTTEDTAMSEFAKGAVLSVRPGDVESLAGALDMAVRGDATQPARRRRGLEIARAHTWERAAREHLAIYLKLAPS